MNTENIPIIQRRLIRSSLAFWYLWKQILAHIICSGNIDSVCYLPVKCKMFTNELPNRIQAWDVSQDVRLWWHFDVIIIPVFTSTTNQRENEFIDCKIHDIKSKLIFIDALFTGGVLFSLVMRCYVIIMEEHKKMIYTQHIIRIDTDQRDSLASILEA